MQAFLEGQPYPVESVRDNEEILALVGKGPADALLRFHLFHRKDRKIYLCEDGPERGVFVLAPNLVEDDRWVAAFRVTSNALILPFLSVCLSRQSEYIFIADPSAAGVLQESLQISSDSCNDILSITPETFRPCKKHRARVETHEHEQFPGYALRDQGQVVATAAILWETDSYAELYVYTDETVRGKRFGEAVASACVADALQRRVTPLFIIEPENKPAARLARKLGFQPTGAGDYTCVGRFFTVGEAN